MQRLLRRAAIVSLLCWVDGSAFASAPNPPASAGGGGKGRKLKAAALAPAARAPETDKYKLGIGVGLFNLFLPQPALQATYFFFKGRFEAGVQLGYLSLPLSNFQAQSLYEGADLKYLPAGGPLYFGVAYGMRSLSLTTSAPITVNGDETQVAWRRDASQSVIIPRIGWVKVGADGTGTTLSVGYLLPLGTNFSITPSPESVPGFPADRFEAERAQKGDDVKKYTNVGYPHIELSYFWYLGPF